MSWFKDMTAQELQEYVGDINQLAGTRSSTINDGQGFNTRICEVNTASGLSYTVLPDRGMDILSCRYKGIPIAPISKVGLRNPEATHDHQYNFFKNFSCGLLTTCGLNHIGPPSEKYGLHGPISNIRAERFSVDEFWQQDDYIILLKGTMRQAVFFGENIHLQRTIKTSLKSSAITITDTITNKAFRSEKIRMLYHINFGFPLLSPDTQIVLPEVISKPRDNEAKKSFSNFLDIQPPQRNFSEQVYLHKLTQQEQSSFYVKNPKIGIAVCCKFNPEQLPYLTQWNQFGQGEYVLGLEPGLDWPLEQSHVGIELSPHESFSTSIILEFNQIT